MDPESRSSATGVAFGLAAYVWWGLSPVYFKAVDHVPASEVLAHRIVWSLVLLLVWVAATRQIPALRAALRLRGTSAGVVATTALITLNWFTFIWAIFSGQVIQASLGYFINPLVNVVLGRLVLGEALRPLQWIAVGLAALGVGAVTLVHGEPPTLALLLAGSFGLYGLIRKRARVDAAAGLFAETTLLMPLALGFLMVQGLRGELFFGTLSLGTDLLLLAGGAVTALPLLWFVSAARRLRYVTVGFLHYVAPTLQLLLAVAVYGEPFAPAMQAAFVLIWCALGLFSADALRARPKSYSRS
jgi:chloramphenicol-sensitive protein RarD